MVGFADGEAESTFRRGDSSGEALAFDGGDLLAACKRDPQFGFVFMHRLLGVVAERLQATRLQLLDMYSPRRPTGWSVTRGNAHSAAPLAQQRGIYRRARVTGRR